jgi:hypothetical protein
MDDEKQLKKWYKKHITKLKHPLPSYEISFEKHFEIIKAYVELSKEGKELVSWKDFEGLVSMSSKYISANNKFFESIGLIKASEKVKRKYYPTQEAIEFSKAKVWDEEKAKAILRELIKNSWFWKSAKQLLNVRNGKCSKDELIKKLGIDSGADKKHYPSLNVLIEYLMYVDLIGEKNGVISHGKFGREQPLIRKIEVPVNKDMVQIKLSDGLYAVDIKELESFMREKGKKLDEEVYRL